MNKNLSITYSVVKGANTYTFILPFGAPLGEAYDAAFALLQDIAADAQKRVEEATKQPEGGPVRHSLDEGGPVRHSFNEGGVEDGSK